MKKLSVEDLMNLDVTLVSRTPEKLTKAPSAIQVITGEDIRRSGATNVPDALRLVPNVQVAQLSSNAWIISARGFNTIFANKLLVMIDGRTVYTQLFGGVLWEQQNLLLEDVDRIEVVSGPGGTLWGANAVNGVINIVTKQASETRGLSASVAAGTFVKDNVAVRYGGQINRKIDYRIFAQHFDRDGTTLPNGAKMNDAWRVSQAGFRMDWTESQKDAFTIQGDQYWGARKTLPSGSTLNGQNILARWAHTFSQTSAMTLQVYYDRYFREDAPSASYDKMNTFDIDFQHRFTINSWHRMVWGGLYRYVKDDANFSNTAGAGILPRFRRLDRYNAFIQDEIALTERLRFTAGVKVLHNVYTGFEWAPNARIAWNSDNRMIWAAVSRAVRVPSRLDRDYFLPMNPPPPGAARVAGGPDFESETVIAYELGYRMQPNSISSFSISTFYNNYRDVYSVEALPGTLTYQIMNGSRAESWGAELAGNYQLHKNWRVRGGYTFFKKDIKPKPGRNFNPDYLANDATHMAVLQSIADLPFGFQLDLTGRHVGELPKTLATERVPSYFTFDARLAYARKGIEVAIVGQNLASREHPEFGTANIPRHAYVKITARF